MKKLKDIKKIMIDNKTYILIFMFILFLCSLFPYTGDDWAWGSEIGAGRLNDFFKDYNGRYLGNLIVIFLTRSLIIRNITMAGILTGILYLCKKITNNSHKTLFLIATLLLLAIPRLVFRQAIVWTSGFTNYSISIFLVLIYIYLIRDLFNKKPENGSTSKLIASFFLAFATGLFIENITIYIILLSIFVVIYAYIRYKQIPKFSIYYLLGSITSTAVMFSNGAYYNILNNADGYRQVPTDGVISFIEKSKDNYFNTIYSNLLFNNLIINIFITVLLVYLVHKFITNRNSNKNIKIVVLYSIFVVILYNLYTLYSMTNSTWQILLKYTNWFEGLISILYFGAILIITFFCIESKNKKYKLLFYLLSIIFLTVPLFVVNPIGSRCFLATYIFFILYVLELYNYLFNNLLNKTTTEYINKVIIICILFLGTYLVNIYLYVTKIDIERINYIHSEIKKGSTTIMIPYLPYEYHVWWPNPQHNTKWETRFKLFYNIDERIDIIPISLRAWNKLNNK